MFLLVISGFLTLLFVLHYFTRYGRIGNISSRIAGPKAFPIIGNLYHLQVDNEQLLEKLWKINKEFSPINRLWSLFFSLITIIHPEDVEILLKSTQHLEKTIPYKFLQPWLSTGLITGAGEKWQNRRKILTPTFHFNNLKHFVVSFNEEAQYLVTLLKEEGKGGSIIKDLQEFLPVHTLNAICETAMGTSLRGTGEFETKYRHAVHDFGKIAVYRVARPWYHSDTIFALSQRGKQQKELLKTLHGFSKKIIAERILFHEQTNGKYLQNVEEMDENQIFYEETDENNKNPIFKKRLALLDLLIAASLNDNQIDEEGIREEVDTFMAAGHDTTAMALCFALLLFAKHKDVQEHIRSEVNTVMQQSDCKLTIPMLRGFPYLERCLKESLRLYPSVHFIARYISQDLQLKNFLIPAGSICNVNIYSLHRNPNIWKNPDVFDADRFLPENTKGRNPYSFIPFSAGPRNCIGQKFAMLELKLMVAYILHNFYLEPVDELDEVKMSGDITLCSTKPIRVEFIPIK
ncbi:cytochrome P450 4C1-like isoform X2 [Vespa velutina]|uniref:cytochrome P450 4C1-like isoform X2 n=1 Tax=Vespa velutina TaxID=202808 RepID=UPI001FB39292|nr:cytochrome P450 4C1-like isoform X2 [Vespa velutina]